MKSASALAELIDGLVNAGMNLRDLNLIGHSLGAHIAGLAGKKLISFEKIGAIVGLDPAAVLFNVNESEYRLAHTDAEYVQVIHTDTDGGRLALGIDEPLGHGWYFPENKNSKLFKNPIFYQVISIRTMAVCSRVVYRASKFRL